MQTELSELLWTKRKCGTINPVWIREHYVYAHIASYQINVWNENKLVKDKVKYTLKRHPVAIFSTTLLLLKE